MRGLFFLAPSLQASTLRSLRLLLPRCLFDRRWAAAANGFPATPKWPPHTRCMTRAAASRTACRHMLASLTPRSCISYTRAATSRVQHCWQRRSLLIVSLSYKLNMTCAAGAPTAPSTGRKQARCIFGQIWGPPSVSSTTVLFWARFHFGLIPGDLVVFVFCIPSSLYLASSCASSLSSPTFDNLPGSVLT